MSFFRVDHKVDHVSDPEALQALVDKRTEDGWELTHLVVWNLRLVVTFSRYDDGTRDNTIRFKEVPAPPS